MANETGLLGGTDKLKMFIDLLSSEEKDQILEILLQENREKKKSYGEPIPELVGNFDNVLKYIKDKCVKTQEMYLAGKGFIHTVELPAVGEFEGFKFKYFEVSGLRDLDSYDGCLNGSSMGYSMEEIGEILQKINEFLMAYGVGDGNINSFSEKLKSWARGTDNRNGDVRHLNAGKVLYNILGRGSYRLNDKVPSSHGLFGRAVLLLDDEGCDFRYSTQYDYNMSYIIFKL